jgi:lysophospholipase L1-like esterase
MFEWFKRSIVAGAVAVLFVASPTRADDPKPAVKEAPKPVAKASAVDPAPRQDAWWTKRHEGFLADLEKVKGNVDLLFVGDSITDGWRNGEPKGGKPVWDKVWGPMKPFNIGIGGDQTQHVVWRLQQGEVAGIKPKLAVLMIGTNNLGRNTNEEIAAGITACVKEIQKQLPTTKVLLLGVFPRGAKADDKARGRIKAINETISKLDDGGKTVKYLDIGDKFLDKDGNIPKDVMYDALHPGTGGYQIWADAIKPTVEDMMK